MVLSVKSLERELAASKAAVKAHKDGLEIHKIVIAAFEEELEKSNANKD